LEIWSGFLRCIELPLAIIGLAQADHLQERRPPRVDKDVQSRADETKSDFANLAIVGPIVDAGNGRRKIEPFDNPHFNAMLSGISFAFGFIPGEALERREFRRVDHAIYVGAKNKGVKDFLYVRKMVEATAWNGKSDGKSLSPAATRRLLRPFFKTVDLAR
jgi:hypothetical protein